MTHISSSATGLRPTLTAGAPERWADELMGALPICAVCVFAANNLWLKHAYPGWWTGKLSDLAACFFAPLFVSAVLFAVGVRWSVRRRIVAGAFATGAIMIAVKTSSLASAWLCELCDPFVRLFGARSVNVVDPSDLIALPCCALAVVYGRRRFANEPGDGQRFA